MHAQLMYLALVYIFSRQHDSYGQLTFDRLLLYHSQGNTPEELPEQMLACVRNYRMNFNVDSPLPTAESNLNDSEISV
jgi:hypothetical protein